MKKLNEYEKFNGILNYLKSGEGSLNSAELELIDELGEIVQLDRSNSIINYLFHHDKDITKILEDINKEIENNKTLIKSTSGLKVKKYIYRKDKLIGLRDSILDYINNQEIDNEDNIQEVIRKCCLSLKLTHYSLPLFFGKKMIEEKDGKYIINKDTVSKVYSILEDSNLMQELEGGVQYIEDENKKKSIINSCREANANKKKIYANSKLIFEYNRVSRDLYGIKVELRSSKYRNLDKKISDLRIQLNTLTGNKIKKYFNREKELELTTKLDKLYELRKSINEYKKQYEDDLLELERLSRELKKVGLLDYVERKDASNKEKSGSQSLHHMLSYVGSDFELDSYYNSIDKDYKEAKRDLRLIRTAKSEYIESISREASKLLTENSEDVQNIMDFREKAICSDITPSIAIFVVKGLIVLEDSLFADKKISDSEIDGVNKYYEGVMKANYESFIEEFSEAKHSKPKTYKK